MGAWGDLEGNVMAAPTPATSPLVDEVLEEAGKLSNELCPKTRAYHAIWLEGQEVNFSAEENAGFSDPLYQKHYLPRKFNTGFIFPPLPDVDIFPSDLAFVVSASNAHLAGYNLLPSPAPPTPPPNP